MTIDWKMLSIGVCQQILTEQVMSPPQASAQHGDPGGHRARGQEHPGISAQYPGPTRSPAEGQGVDGQSGSHSGKAAPPSETL